MTGIRFEELESRIVPTNSQLVTSWYVELLGREPSVAEVSSLATALDQGVVTREQAVQGFVGSVEFAQRTINQTYVDLLQREASESDFDAWVGTVQSGNLQGFTAAVVASAEYYQTRANNDPALFIDSVYVDLLGRSADAAAFNAWLTLVDSGNRSAVADGIEFSVERSFDIVDELYVFLLGREADSSAEASWAPVVRNSGTDDAIVGISSSDEYFTRATLLFPDA